MVEAPRPDDTLEPTFAHGLRFACTRCAACCRHVGLGVGLTEADQARFGKGLADAEALDHPVFLARLPSDRGTCAFLTGNDCSVYRRRPLVCSLYPFYVGVGADGTLQLSVDHCPGVDVPEGDLVDDQYVKRELLPVLKQDPSHLAALRERIAAAKGGTYRIVGGTATEVRSTWTARKKLWSMIFSILENELPLGFTPRDRFECLKADVIPWIEARIIALGMGGGSGILDDGAVTKVLEPCEDRAEVLLRSARAQEEHRNVVQKEGQVTGDNGGGLSRFTTRTGEAFDVSTREVVRMRELAPEAFRAEMSYLREMVEREFVYAGVVVPPLTLRQEASLLFYTSDSIELMANANSVRLRRDRVGLEEMTSAICEADSHVLSTVQYLGVQIGSEIGSE